MNMIFLGDVVGKGGRSAVKKLLPELKREFNAQFAVVNGENAAAGSGLSGSCLRELLEVADVVTSGDHTWDQKGFENEIAGFDRCIRPANFSIRQPGRGYGIFRNPLGGEVAVIVLQGKVFMRDSAYCPFETVEKILASLPKTVKTILVDFHAEATSEKLAMGYFLEGKVTAVLGTHTHVQTADARVLPGGTAYLTDAGMCGADRSVLGREVDAVLKKFHAGMPVRLPVVESGAIRVDGVAISYDQATGRAAGITPFSRIAEI
ncbi:MAG: YmdB family metallophosphoesterase [Lentisphaeria bacterium]|nr:YmdB family metallophosphoesterase [Lentisphaeria bacterium]